MSPNRHRPHIIILPEDRANEQIANGFIFNNSIIVNNIQIIPPAGGWIKVIEKFNLDLLPTMQEYINRIVVLLIDFDNNSDRLKTVKQDIPELYLDRVFVLGVFTEPEELRRDVGRSFEDIGTALANECFEGRHDLWVHNLLDNNRCELERFASVFRTNFIRLD